MTATGYKPQQRESTCNVLTRAGWLTGSFHVPEKSGFVDFLNRATEFHKLTGVSMPGRFDNRNFIALQREAMIVVIPGAGETNLKWRPETEAADRHGVSCLLELGVIDGTIETLKGVRISDFFAHRKDFVVIEDATFTLGWPGAATPAPAQRVPRLLVNATAILGISDLP